MNGTKNIPFKFNKSPIFLHAFPKPSLIDTAGITGFSFLKVTFVAIVTEVSIKPEASFAKVLPVQGSTIRAPSKFFCPIGSILQIVFITFLSHILQFRL